MSMSKERRDGVSALLMKHRAQRGRPSTLHPCVAVEGGTVIADAAEHAVVIVADSLIESGVAPAISDVIQIGDEQYTIVAVTRGSVGYLCRCRPAYEVALSRAPTKSM